LFTLALQNTLKSKMSEQQSNQIDDIVEEEYGDYVDLDEEYEDEEFEEYDYDDRNDFSAQFSDKLFACLLSF
jgi:hypothetical protein